MNHPAGTPLESAKERQKGKEDIAHRICDLSDCGPVRFVSISVTCTTASANAHENEESSPIDTIKPSAGAIEAILLSLGETAEILDPEKGLGKTDLEVRLALEERSVPGRNEKRR